MIDCLERLNRSGIPYMLTGSMASNYWGIPRSTHDLDFVLSIRPDDVSGLMAAFQEDFFLQSESIHRAFMPPHQFNAIDKHSAFKIDFWMLGNNTFEKNVFARRLKVTLFDLPAWIMTAEDAILHKLYWNHLSPSERQLGDVAGIYAVQAKTLDVDYLRHWATMLELQTELKHLISGKIKPKNT